MSMGQEILLFELFDFILERFVPHSHPAHCSHPQEGYMVDTRFTGEWVRNLLEKLVKFRQQLACLLLLLYYTSETILLYCQLKLGE